MEEFGQSSRHRRVTCVSRACQGRVAMGRTVMDLVCVRVYVRARLGVRGLVEGCAGGFAGKDHVQSASVMWSLKTVYLKRLRHSHAPGQPRRRGRPKPQRHVLGSAQKEGSTQTQRHVLRQRTISSGQSSLARFLSEQPPAS